MKAAALPTRREARLEALKILKRYITKTEWRRAGERERCAPDDEPSDTRGLPLRVSSSDNKIRACTRGCILQKLAFRLEKKLRPRLDEYGYTVGNGDNELLWVGIFTPRQVEKIVDLNDSGHWNKLKAFLKP